MQRFLPGVSRPKAYPLGLIGPADMDPALLPLVIRVVNKLTWRLPNLEILCHGLRDRLSWAKMGGIEVVSAKYAGRYWYDLKVYRKPWRGEWVNGDPFFFQDAAGFIAFHDGGDVTKYHVSEAKKTGKRVKVYELN